MNIALSDRRVSARHNFKLPLRVRILKSAIAEQRTESVNRSERGIYFPTNSPLRVGTAVQVLLKMPEEITGEPANEWLCSGHMVRIESFDSPRGKLGWAFNLIAMRFLGGQSVHRRRVIGGRAGKRDNHELVRRPPCCRRSRLGYLSFKVQDSRVNGRMEEESCTGELSSWMMNRQFAI